MTGIRIALMILAVAAGLATPTSSGEHSNVLWHVVHYLCMTNKRVSGLAAPCLSVDRADGYAVVPDPNSPTQVLLVPTRRIAGIESGELLQPGTPNYFQFAWDARRYVERRVHRPLPRDAVGLAVNSVYGRTQDQLHIHVDCVNADVREALQSRQASILGAWSPFPVPLAGRRYRALRLMGKDLDERDPFKLLADSSASARANMARQTLAVIGASFAGQPGFVLLAASGGQPENPEGASEDLLDHACRVLRPAVTIRR